MMSCIWGVHMDGQAGEHPGPGFREHLIPEDDASVMELWE